EGYHIERTAMEIARYCYNLRAVGSDSLYSIAPAPRQLKGGFHRLHPTVHRQHYIIPEIGRDVLGKFAKQVAVERPRGKRKLLRLLHQRPHNLGVAVPLVHRRITGEEVIITLVVHIP